MELLCNTAMQYYIICKVRCSMRSPEATIKPCARSIPLSKINGLHRLNYMEHSYEFELFSIFGHDTAKIKSR